MGSEEYEIMPRDERFMLVRNLTSGGRGGILGAQLQEMVGLFDSIEEAEAERDRLRSKNV